MKNVVIQGTVVFAFLTALAFAQTPKSTQPSPQIASAQAVDQQFIKTAAEGSMAEVEMGRLAAERASHSDVKAFGQKMVDDHEKVDSQLKSIAAEKHVALATALSAKDKSTYDRLSRLSGNAFDRAYMQDMVQDHQTDIAAFKSEASGGKDPDVKAFASKTLPTLENHLKAAETTSSAVATMKTSTKAPTAKPAAATTASVK